MRHVGFANIGNNSSGFLPDLNHMHAISQFEFSTTAEFEDLATQGQLNSRVEGNSQSLYDQSNTAHSLSVLGSQTDEQSTIFGSWEAVTNTDHAPISQESHDTDPIFTGISYAQD